MCVCVQIFDIPVFWPILLLYFIALFVLTMKRQIQHMVKHRYVPFSWGKQRYKGELSRPYATAHVCASPHVCVCVCVCVWCAGKAPAKDNK